MRPGQGETLLGDWGLQIKAYRWDTLHCTQKELAQRWRVSPRTIQEWEQGRRHPRSWLGNNLDPEELKRLWDPRVMRYYERAQRRRDKTSA